MSEMTTLTEQNWKEEVLNSDLLTIVDFWAQWCTPCHMIAPIVEEISREYEGKIKVGKLNVDENPGIAGKYRIMGIPTLLFFRNGEIVDRIVGIAPKKAIQDKIEKLLGEE